MNELERVVAEMLLAGEDPELRVLRQQLRTATVAEREFTGVGFFTHIAVDPDAEPITRNVVIGDVYAEVRGLEYPAGFLLFVKNGRLDLLECFIADEGWPDDAELVRAYYMHPEVPDSPRLVETERRDLVWALRQAG